MPPFFAKSLLPWDDKVMSMACTRKAWPSLSSCAKSRLDKGRWPLRDDHDRSMVRWLWLVENQTSWGSKKKQPLWHVPFNFMRFFPISLLNLFHQGFIGPKNTKKSSTKRSIYSSLSLVLSPYQPLRSWYLPPEEKCGSVGRHRWVNSLEGIFFEMKNLMLEEKWTQHFADCTST